VLGPKRLQVHYGDLVARVAEDGKGFTIVTSIGKIIDLGTEFGLSVQTSGETDLVVFDGKVDVEYHDRSDRAAGRAAQIVKGRWRVKTGQAVRIDQQGRAHRIAQVDFDRFPRDGAAAFDRRPPRRVIESISDNGRAGGVGPYYQIHHEGLTEDVRAYVDRHYEWNGVDESGIPENLRGADYVMMFNDDKARPDYEITLDLARPADVYVFWDDRFQPPQWLVDGFVATDEKIGMDEQTWPLHWSKIGTGPGQSVDLVFSIWKARVADISSPLILGEVGARHVGVAVSMYGIAAVALP
jgi:hypothetical protein